MKFLTEEKGETTRKTYLDSISSTTKFTWNEQDATKKTNIQKVVC